MLVSALPGGGWEGVGDLAGPAFPRIRKRASLTIAMLESWRRPVRDGLLIKEGQDERYP